MRVVMSLSGTDRGRSGIGTVIKELLPRLRRRIARAHGELVVLGTEQDIVPYEPLLDGARRMTLPAGLDAPGPNALWHLLRVGSAARAAGADVLLLPAANRRMGALLPLPTVGVVHDLAQVHVAKKYDPLRQAYLKVVLVRALMAADQLIAVSDATRRDTEAALGRRCPPVTVVHHGVDHERFTPPAAGDERVLEARRAMELDRPYVLYLSRLEHPGKNHVRLVRCFARSRAHSTHVLALAGPDWGGEAEIRREAEERGISDRVKVLGFVDDGLLPGLLAGADAVAVVGLHEGFGLPALEALSAGRPVFASSTGALPEVVGHLAALCDPRNDSAMLGALDRALYDDELRGRASTEGPIWAAERGWGTTAEAVHDVCRRAAEAGR